VHHAKGTQTADATASRAAPTCPQHRPRVTHQRLAQHVRARPTRVSLSAASRATAAQAGCHGRPAWLSWPRASSSKKRAHQGGDKAHTKPADPPNQPAHGGHKPRRATRYSATPCTTTRAGKPCASQRHSAVRASLSARNGATLTSGPFWTCTNKQSPSSRLPQLVDTMTTNGSNCLRY
jgi:hypothetical protein